MENLITSLIIRTTASDDDDDDEIFEFCRKRRKRRIEFLEKFSYVRRKIPKVDDYMSTVVYQKYLKLASWRKQKIL